MKIVLIGAGSYVFAAGVVHDAIVDHRIDGLELSLVDVDLEAAQGMAAVAERMASDAGLEVEASATDDRAAALPGADYVVVCAEVQGARRWQMDYEVLSEAGMPEQARECGGLGGLLKALRTTTLVLDIARDMERLCPRAWLLDVTNPMPRVVTAVTRATKVRCAGFCNAAWGAYGDYHRLGRLLGLGKLLPELGDLCLEVVDPGLAIGLLIPVEGVHGGVEGLTCTHFGKGLACVSH